MHLLPRLVLQHSVDAVNMVSTSPQVGLGLPHLAVSDPLPVQEKTANFGVCLQILKAAEAALWSLSVSGRIGNPSEAQARLFVGRHFAYEM